MRGIRMKIEAVEHITINVKDLERTIQFYGGVLGLKQLPKKSIWRYICLGREEE